MATVQAETFVTIPSAADYSAAGAGLNRFVDVNSSGQAVVQTTAGGRAVGVLANKPPAANRAAKVQVGGIANVIAGGSFNAGADLQCHTDGSAIVASTGDYVLAVALEGGATGKVVKALLVSPFKAP